jgi:hypothetical protein
MTLEQLWVADRSVAAAKDATLYLFLGRVLTNIVAHECFTPTKAAYICVDQPIIIFALATRRNNKLFGEAAGESSVVRETGTTETVLSVGEMPDPHPATGEIRIHIAASAPFRHQSPPKP